jgi:hypothetical protein
MFCAEGNSQLSVIVDATFGQQAAGYITGNYATTSLNFDKISTLTEYNGKTEYQRCLSFHISLPSFKLSMFDFLHRI